jgi:4-nitrophenyl phosphatase
MPKMNQNPPNRNIKGLILDMDGVLWRWPDPIGDLPGLFAFINQRGWKVVFLTNNATLSARQYTEILNNFGFPAHIRQVINSAEATGEYLKEKYPHGGSIFIIGEDGLRETLERFGFNRSGDGHIAVIVGLDRQLTYEKLSQASLSIQDGAEFIGTNPDTTIPTHRGIEPGAGSILAAVQVASGHLPVVIGKPSSVMYQIALSRLGTSPKETLVIGDRLDTDIAGGQAAGCLTGLVLSGVAKEEDLPGFSQAPDYIASDLHELLMLI